MQYAHNFIQRKEKNAKKNLIQNKNFSDDFCDAKKIENRSNSLRKKRQDKT